MLQLSAAYTESVRFTGYAAVECIDSPHPVGSDEYRAFAQELEALSPRFGAAVANELLPCAFWPAPVHDIVGPITAPGSPPILVIGTTGDAATPYEQAVAVAKTLQNGHLLTFKGDGHAAYGKSTCAAAAEAAYFVDLTVPSEGASCSQ
jgi:pimeloyl-ACP methyl ester carboxylesterase